MIAGLLPKLNRCWFIALHNWLEITAIHEKRDSPVFTYQLVSVLIAVIFYL